jgi:hypothetical protein
MIIEQEALLSGRGRIIGDKESQLVQRDRMIAVRDAVEALVHSIGVSPAMRGDLAQSPVPLHRGCACSV